MADLAVDLSFVTDDRIRELLQDYHQQAVYAYRAGAYLGTLVACGAVVEGILTWALLQRTDRAVRRFKEKYPGHRDANQVEKWDISRLIDVAVDEELLGHTAKSASWAVKEFRNFIHPYGLIRAQKSARADEALALSALTAVTEICRSLKGRVAAEEAS